MIWLRLVISDDDAPLNGFVPAFLHSEFECPLRLGTVRDSRADFAMSKKTKPLDLLRLFGFVYVIRPPRDASYK